MAFITLSGTLLDPNGDLAVGDQIRFTHKSTTGETVESAVSLITVNPAGTYSLPLQYGLVLVEYKDVRTQQFKNLGVATVNSDNPATSIPELLNALVPVSSAELIEFQAILADCVTAQNAAAVSAVAALVSENAAAASAATIDLINDLSQAYIFETVGQFKASTILFPDGKTIHLNDRDADFTKITGIGTATGYKIIASTSVDQSIDLIVTFPFNVKHWGALLDGSFNDSGAVQAADDYLGVFMGGVLNFPSGTLSIGTKINKSLYTHWVGEVANNYFNAANTDWSAGTRIRPLYDGVLIESSYVSGNTLVGYCGLENFSCAGRLEETGDFDNVVVYKQSGARISGLKFKNLIFKRVFKGLEVGDASFCSFKNLDFRCKENIDAPKLSDSEFVRVEVGSGLPAAGALKTSLSGGYGLRMIGDDSAGTPFNGNNKFHRCRFQLAADTFTNLRAEWMENLKFFDCIFDQNEAQGGVFLECNDIEFHGASGFNNAGSDGVSPKWALQFGLGGANGCTGVKFFGGKFFNKVSPNANPEQGSGLLFSDAPDAELHAVTLDDTLVTKISGLSTTAKIYGGNVDLPQDLTLQNSWVENSGTSTPEFYKEANICHVSGAIKDGAVLNTTVITTLPVGYRPTRTKYVLIFSGASTNPEYLSISTNGNISIQGGDWASNALIGIDFSFSLIS